MTQSEELVRIGQAARAANVSVQTLEYYVMLGLIVPITPPGTRRRLFNQELIRRIKLIRRLIQGGYGLRDIGLTFLKKR
jgi:DNA-binding transcriptional MerR regulator